MAASLLVACNPSTTTQIPTRAIVAANASEQIVVVNKPLLSVGDSQTLPPTWTPDPATMNRDTGNAGIVANLLPTPLPTATTLFPTRTPRPTETATPLPTATQTAIPTATPVPTNAPIVAAPGLPPPTTVSQAPLPSVNNVQLKFNGARSKLGIHVIRNNDPRIMDFVRQAQPAVMKAVDDLGFLEEVKKASPNTVTIGRVNDPNQGYSDDPEKSARDFVAKQISTYLANPYVDYWEGWNEPDPNLEHMAWYARFEQERVRILAGYGLKAAIGGFATGVPEIDEFMLFLPAIDTAMQHQGILALHEYGAPDLKYLYGEPLPGRPTYPDRGSLTFRYRHYYRDILLPSGRDIPLAITEAGVDGIIGNRPGPNGLGWHDFDSYWVDQGWGATGEEAFINQLAWYDKGVREDNYVIGFTVFTAGGISNWVSYDINPLLPYLANYVQSQW